MTKLKTMLAAIFLIPVGAMTVACGSTPAGGTANSSDFGVASNAHYVDLPDGRKVLCVYETRQSRRDGGPSCDWANAK
ncbi:membrane protein [Mycobacterium phage Skinny]|uniref:Lipoprotein n=6 Tax=Bongovirus bongo TaxID=1983750 RepID=A0A0M5M0S2_9CAUD|nr:hypothetical protein PEGLEG_5 [Mycobacterium phage PegLeg]YP_009604863.1 hypothetical protein FDH95_gp005 [Mycobacterium phage Bongo]ALF00533.1 hypothetical protein SEA_BRICOLE_5 [Mycobacterium phage Bricole]AXQ52646.1 hypothetical protein SEA_IPHANE7_5 [Mycobacterium phage IPhane7]QDH93579.1 hypothetical protein SEA_LILHOMIEP_5 [Mycobacterium phage LilhomieP]QGJ93152.1 membrane protein [Mycobacterium phage TyDawg]QUU29206.1 hypothetical protein [Mycobacterium phage SirSheldon]UXE05214.1 